MTKLDDIIARKRDHVALMKNTASHEVLLEMARSAPPTRGFYEALMRQKQAGGFGLIAEIKKASPSQGLIRADFDPEALAKAYEAGGATCLSVLTDEYFFQGHDNHLTRAREASNLPCLRKDFIIDPYQIAESRALGADCILLILAALEDHMAAELEREAISFGLDVLLEVHDEAELERAFKLQSPLIGVNNRDLATLEVDLSTSHRLAGKITPNRLMVSESGLQGRAELLALAKKGISAFLVGEALLREADVTRAVGRLLGDD